MANRYTDQEVLTLLQSGDTRKIDAAIGYLYTSCKSMIFRMVSQKGGSYEDGEEVLNDTLMVFFRKVMAGKYEIQNAQIKSYLYSVAYNKWLKQFDKNRHWLNRNEDISQTDLADSATDSLQHDFENQDMIQRLLDRLEPKCQALIKNVLEGWTMQEIAQRLNLGNADNAKAHKYECLKKLKKISL